MLDAADAYWFAVILLWAALIFGLTAAVTREGG